MASSATRTARRASGRGRPARLRRQRQAAPRLRRLDDGRRHRRTHSGAGAFLGDPGRPRRRRPGLLGHRLVASAAGVGDRTDQLSASGGVAAIRVDATRPGLRAVADVAAIPDAAVARAAVDPRQRRRDRAPGPQSQLRANGLPPKTSPRPSVICGRRSNSRRPRTAPWNTSAGRCAASCATKAGDS